MQRIVSLGLGVALGVVGVLGVVSADPPAVPRGFRPYLVAISVASVDASATWYQETLGLELVEKKAFDEQGIKVAFLKSDGFRLELVELKKSVNPATCTDTSNPAALRGYSKVAFQVDDLGEVVRRLGQHGVSILHDSRSAPLADDRSVIVKDGDGNWLQFFQRPLE